MKFWKLALAFSFSFFLAPLSSQAGSGKAIVPQWGSAGSSLVTQILVSNITNHYLAVGVVFYGQNGSPVTNGVVYNNLSNNTIIAPNNSAYVQIQNQPSLSYGYAIINWQNQGSDNDAIGLVAQAFRDNNNGGVYSEASIPINNGLPF